jgi:HemY protein
MTLLRTLFWFAIAAVAMFAAVWLAERPGTVTAEWRGWRLDTTVGVVFIAVVVLILLSVALWLLYRWIVGAPGALFDSWGESKRRRGYQALTQGLAAVAAGDGAEAQKNARKAEQLLSEPPLTLLLSAQAA